MFCFVGDVGGITGMSPCLGNLRSGDVLGILMASGQPSGAGPRNRPVQNNRVSMWIMNVQNYDHVTKSLTRNGEMLWGTFFKGSPRGVRVFPQVRRVMKKGKARRRHYTDSTT